MRGSAGLHTSSQAGDLPSVLRGQGMLRGRGKIGFRVCCEG